MWLFQRRNVCADHLETFHRAWSDDSYHSRSQHNPLAWSIAHERRAFWWLDGGERPVFEPDGINADAGTVLDVGRAIALGDSVGPTQRVGDGRIRVEGWTVR